MSFTKLLTFAFCERNPKRLISSKCWHEQELSFVHENRARVSRSLTWQAAGTVAYTQLHVKCLDKHQPCNGLHINNSKVLLCKWQDAAEQMLLARPKHGQIGNRMKDRINTTNIDSLYDIVCEIKYEVYSMYHVYTEVFESIGMGQIAKKTLSLNTNHVQTTHSCPREELKDEANFQGRFNGVPSRRGQPMQCP